MSGQSKHAVTPFLMLISLLIHIDRSQPIETPPVKTATLTPLDSNNNGAAVMFNIQEVTPSDTHWDVNTIAETGWNFIIKTDETFAIDTTKDSIIEFTTNIYQSPNTQSLIFGFTTDNKQYISTSIPMDSLGKINKIYPTCSSTSTFSSAVGDIAAIPKTDRHCDIPNGNCDNWQYMLPYNFGSNARTPNKLTFKFKYSIQTNEVIFYYHSSYFAPEFVQTCRFANQFVSKNGLKIYVAGHGPYESYKIQSFVIKSVFGPTASPTPSPTNLITLQPSHNPTTSPTNKPSQNPIRIKPTGKPTSRPSNFPSFKPTGNPTSRPSNFPSYNPTGNTGSPTNNPTIFPTYNPSVTPTNNPTNKPTNNPTGNTISPSKSPSNFPTFKPTGHPTTRPSNFPSYNPTNFPTKSPTVRPTPFGKKWGAYNQLCFNPLVGTQHQCSYSTDILTDTLGSIQCGTAYDCCMCKTIECGLNGPRCEELMVLGDYGIYGVQDIFLIGSPSDLVNPISIDCQGIGSCSYSMITAAHVGIMECDRENACYMAQIIIVEPRNDFVLNCGGVGSCQGMNIHIIIPQQRGNRICNNYIANNYFSVTKIACNAERACENMQITIENNGCDKVIIRDLECIQPNSCNNVNFNLIGDVTIENCQLHAELSTTIGLEQCFNNNLNLYNFACNDPRECYQKHKIIENPRNGFEFICGSTESCTQGEFVIKLNDNFNKLEFVDYINIKVSGDFSAQYATFIIENTQTNGRIVNVNLIECNGHRSCEWATFIIGVDVGINEVSCTHDACDNCYIKQSKNTPGIPCDPTSVSSFIQI